MKFLSFVVISIFLAILSTQSLSAQEKHREYPPFPLNNTVNTAAYSGSSLHIRTTCTVNKRVGDKSYSYVITVDYETRKRMLLSWNFLDWILSQYPNAIETRHSSPNLFLLKAGKGNYTFRFKSLEKPLWFGETVMRVFPNEPLNARELENNKAEAKEYSGVTISSYDYVKATVGLGKIPSCLPANLLVFPNSTRSGL